MATSSGTSAVVTAAVLLEGSVDISYTENGEREGIEQGKEEVDEDGKGVGKAKRGKERGEREQGG